MTQTVSTQDILPSQDFLKPRTVGFILECYQTGQLEELPPAPLVRRSPAGQLIAIDGHNLIAVNHYRGEPIGVIVAESANDGLPATSEANITRNSELALKFDDVLDDQAKTAATGVNSFADLIAKYPELFT